MRRRRRRRRRWRNRRMSGRNRRMRGRMRRRRRKSIGNLILHLLWKNVETDHFRDICYLKNIHSVLLNVGYGNVNVITMNGKT